MRKCETAVTSCNQLNTFHCSTLIAVVTNRFLLVDIFGEKSSERPEILKVLEYLTGKEIEFGDAVNTKTVQTMYKNVKNVKELLSLLLASLFSEELSIVGSCGKIVCGS